MSNNGCFKSIHQIKLMYIVHKRKKISELVLWKLFIFDSSYVGKLQYYVAFFLRREKQQEQFGLCPLVRLSLHIGLKKMSFGLRPTKFP